MYKLLARSLFLFIRQMHFYDLYAVLKYLSCTLLGIVIWDTICYTQIVAHVYKTLSSALQVVPTVYTDARGSTIQSNQV